MSYKRKCCTLDKLIWAKSTSGRREGHGTLRTSAAMDEDAGRVDVVSPGLDRSPCLTDQRHQRIHSGRDLKPEQ